MTDEDLVIRRRQRTPLRLAHVLEGASAGDLDTYRAEVEGENDEITTHVYSNKKRYVGTPLDSAELTVMVQAFLRNWRRENERTGQSLEEGR